MRKSVCIYGNEGVNWSVDKDINFAKRVISANNINCSNNLLCGKILCLNWTKFFRRYKFALKLIYKFSEIIVWITNDPEDSKAEFDALLPYVTKFICSNSKQIKYLNYKGFETSNITLLPFWTDPVVFTEDVHIRDEYRRRLSSLPPNNTLIGSFQRDSLKANLNQPKWQKNPQGIVNILRKFPYNEKCTMVLAGPRRHYLVSQLRQNKFNYMYFGDETYIDKKQDDLFVNNLNEQQLAELYGCLSFYLVTSLSEGGPKAILECLNSNCIVFSKRVGLAEDLLTDDFLFDSEVELVDRVSKIEDYKPKFKALSLKFRQKYTYTFYEEKILKAIGYEI